MSLDLAEDTIIIFTIGWDKPRMTWGRGKPVLDTKIQKTQILQREISHKWETSANTSSWRPTLTNPSYSTWLFPQPWPSTSKGCPILFRIATFLVFQIVTFTLNSHTALKVLVQVTTLPEVTLFYKPMVVRMGPRYHAESADVCDMMVLPTFCFDNKILEPG